MLSNKWTFSLTSLILILVLAFMVPPALAQFSVDFEGPDSYSYVPVAAPGATIAVAVDIVTGQSVNLPALVRDPGTPGSAAPAWDIVLHAIHTNGEVLQAYTPAGTPGIAAAPAPAAVRLAGNRIQVTFTVTQVAGANPIDRVVIQVPVLTTNNPTVTGDGAVSEATTHTIHFGGISRASTTAVELDRPKVVSIQRLRPGSQTVVAAFQEAAVSGPFDVRIVITELPHDFGLGHINVANGTASNLVVGRPFARVGLPLPANPPVPPLGAPYAVAMAGTILPHPIEGMYQHSGAPAAANAPGLAGVPNALAAAATLNDDLIPLPSGDDNRYHQYRVTITPHRRADTVSVHVNAFHDNDTPFNNYYQPTAVDRKPNGREQLRLDVDIPDIDREHGYRVVLPHGDGAQITYANGTAGHYILTRDNDGSHIDVSHPADEENIATEQTRAQLLYNVRASGDLPNLETHLANSGTIHLVSYSGAAAGSAYISEVMWGHDASQDPVNLSNWIEIRNGTTAAIGIGENLWALWFYGANETPPTAYPANSYYEGPTGQAGVLLDAISTRDAQGLTWSLANKGQNGRSNIDIARRSEGDQSHVLAPTTALKSMYRVLVPDTSVGAAAGAMMPGDGTLALSWAQTERPAVNLAVGREDAIIATPGALPIVTQEQIDADAARLASEQDAATATAAAEQERIRTTGTYPQRGDGRVYISEIMFAGGGALPQWIEIANGDRAKEFNLSGWTLTVKNAAADADVDVTTATFTIPTGTTISASAQHETPSTILVVTERGRNNIPAASGQVINLAEANEVELILAGIVKGKYSLLSDMAFSITLAPPEPTKTTPPTGETAAARTQRLAAERTATANRTAATDTVGNLVGAAAAWALPMNEDGVRSSIIRRHVQVTRGPAAPEKGTEMKSWVLASETSFAQVTHIRASSYYGAGDDVGTPGFRAGGALPVELSHFSPKRNKDTGAVVITWSTQSELNNAGFFIKRSQQRDGEFKVINATMVAGAGTTSEKQFYTYTDTTAQPNVVYYYQIEDVSLDGNRQTLTRGIRLKGHIGAAGKATTLWGELKTSHE